MIQGVQAKTYTFIGCAVGRCPCSRRKSKNVSFLEIETDKGHDSFLLDEPNLDYAIKGFLDSNFGKINE